MFSTLCQNFSSIQRLDQKLWFFYQNWSRAVTRFQYAKPSGRLSSFFRKMLPRMPKTPATQVFSLGGPTYSSPTCSPTFSYTSPCLPYTFWRPWEDWHWMKSGGKWATMGSCPSMSKTHPITHMEGRSALTHWGTIMHEKGRLSHSIYWALFSNWRWLAT